MRYGEVRLSAVAEYLRKTPRIVENRELRPDERRAGDLASAIKSVSGTT
jgi:hypothetical protein